MNFSAIPIIKIVMKAFRFFFVVTLKNSLKCNFFETGDNKLQH